MPNKTIFDEYIEYLNKYIKEYGQKTIVMMQVGMFHEFYGVDNGREKLGFVREISEILNIQMTRRDKKVLENSRKNYLMAGFPTPRIEHYINILLENSYTVIVIDQIGNVNEPGSNGRVERAVTRICSPGTYIEECRQAENNFLVSIYFEAEATVGAKGLLTVGLAAVDLSTGEIYVHEAYSNQEDTNYAIDESYRFLQAHNPREVVIYCNNLEKLGISQNCVIENLDLHNYIYHIKKELPKDYFKIVYQNKFLKKVYGKDCGILSPIEYLDLESKQLSVLSLLLVLQFSYEHNEKLIEKLMKPSIWESSQHLILANNAINQLSLIPSSGGGGNDRMNRSKFRSLITIIDKTSTSMGKRLLKHRLLNPITHTDKINERYKLIAEMLETRVKTVNGKHIENPNYARYEKFLGNIIDIERMHRKIRLKMLQPTEFNTLHNSYEEILEIIKLIKSEKGDLQMLVSDDLVNKFTNMIEGYKKILDLEETSKYNLGNVTDSFFRVGYNEELDKISYKIKHYNELFRQLSEKLSNMIIRASDCVPLKYSETAGHYFTLTNKRYDILYEAWDNKDLKFYIDDETYTFSLTDFRKERVSPKSASSNLFSEKIKTISDELVALQEKVREKTVKLYLEFLEELDNKYATIMQKISSFTAKIDVTKSNAKTSLQYGYNQPTVKGLKNDGKKSFLKCRGLRHPIIERINQELIYVPHDVSLGETMEVKTGSNKTITASKGNKTTSEDKDNNNDNTETEQDHVYLDGLMVYGVNSSGKSALMKSVGVNLVMAQAGMYVAADYFEFAPYQYLLTRIIGNDNIFKGLSSFAVEMSELRGILKRATPRSLVLGDEICHGTETVSGVAIVASAIRYLSKRKSSFIFATHLHQLADMEEIQELENVQNFHLRVFYDEKSGELVYDRNLIMGSGDPIYGLEVAKAMRLDREFLEEANKIRKKILGVDKELLSTRKSHFNRKIYLDRCQVCFERAVEVHHIGFQCTAGKTGMIEHYHKNIAANLVPLCKKCHLSVHHPESTGKKIEIKGYILSSEGIKLDYN